MEGLVDQVHNRWGTWEGFASAVGMDSDIIAGLRAGLLEEE
jgi:hypothetical protein